MWHVRWRIGEGIGHRDKARKGKARKGRQESRFQRFLFNSLTPETLNLVFGLSDVLLLRLAPCALSLAPPDF